MRVSSIILTICIFLLVFASSCSKEKTQTNYITANVISRPGSDFTEKPVVISINNPADNAGNNTANNTVNRVNQTTGMKNNTNVVVTDPNASPGNTNNVKVPIKPIDTTPIKTAIQALECDESDINLGFKECFNTTQGYIKLFLKNSGYHDITGLEVNIEAKGKPNYERVDLGLKKDQFVEYIFDLGEWRDAYNSTDRIIIIPLTSTQSTGERACYNRALLMNPYDSCTEYIKPGYSS